MYKRLIFLFLISIYSNNIAYGNEVNINNDAPALEYTKKLIGGDRDQHGCLGAAGYMWSQEIGACIRSWEIKSQDQIKAATIAAKTCKNSQYLTILEVEYNNCKGCFSIKLSESNNSTIVTLVNWKLISIIKFL